MPNPWSSDLDALNSIDTNASSGATAAGQTSTNTKLDTLHSDLVTVEGKQDTGNTSLSSVDTKLTNVATTTLQTSGNSTLISILGTLTSTTSTVSRVSSSATSVTLLSLNASRKGAIFYNDSTKACYVKFGTTATSTDFTVKIDSSSIFIVEATPIYTGRIDAIWVAANGAMQVTELT